MGKDRLFWSNTSKPNIFSKSKLAKSKLLTNIPVEFFSFLILFGLEVLKIGELAKWQEKEMSNY